MRRGAKRKRGPSRARNRNRTSETFNGEWKLSSFQHFKDPKRLSSNILTSPFQTSFPSKLGDIFSLPWTIRFLGQCAAHVFKSRKFGLFS